jgi:hypothetical protein
MKLEELSPRQFAETLARMVDSSDGEIFVEWLRAKIRVDSCDPINHYNTIRNEGYRAAYRDIEDFIIRGRKKDSYPEEAET